MYNVWQITGSNRLYMMCIRQGLCVSVYITFSETGYLQRARLLTLCIRIPTYGNTTAIYFPTSFQPLQVIQNDIPSEKCLVSATWKRNVWPNQACVLDVPHTTNHCSFPETSGSSNNLAQRCDKISFFSYPHKTPESCSHMMQHGDQISVDNRYTKKCAHLEP